MKRTLKLFLIFVLIFSSIFAEEVRDPREEKLGYRIGDKVENFNLTSLDGQKEISLENFKGKKVLVNFTTTWCPDCREEKDIMGKDYVDKYRDREDVEFLVIFGPYKTDNKELADKYMAENNYKFPAYYDNSAKVIQQFKVVNVPTSFLIDENGIVEDVNIETGYNKLKYFN